jgi:hypothetical protein
MNYLFNNTEKSKKYFSINSKIGVIETERDCDKEY